jgi:hypothetical protein
MKTTIELPDDLFIAAKRQAAEDRSTLRAIVERGLRAQLRRRRARRTRTGRTSIRWVTVDGGLPPDLDLQDRMATHDWLRSGR